MLENQNLNEFLNWSDELSYSLINKNALCVAIFSIDKKMIFANEALLKHIKGEPSESFISPSFDKLLTFDNTNPIIFDGYMTLGDYDSINISIYGQVYRKNDKILIIGKVDAEQLIEQNDSMHKLFNDISNLQRELIKEKSNLESTIEKVNILNEELERVNNTKDKFFSIISHDLKSPFNSILGLSEILYDISLSAKPEEIKEIANLINDSSKKFFSLLENLLKWASVQRGSIKFEPIKIKPSELILGEFQVFEQIALSKNISLSSQNVCDDFIFADFEMIKTVIRNLINNALKFTNSGGTVKISCKKKDDFVLFSVSDNGVGMDKEQIDNLFKIESNSSKPGTEGEKGTGLGLILCKEFVERQNGKIWVESEVGKGSSFNFTIPVFVE